MTVERDATNRSRGTKCPSCWKQATLDNQQGRREGRVPTAPMAPLQQEARGRTTGTGGSSGLPCAMVLRLIRDLPGDHAWLPPSSQSALCALQDLAPASERQDHTTSPT